MDGGNRRTKQAGHRSGAAERIDHLGCFSVHECNMRYSQTTSKGKICDNSSCSKRADSHEGRMSPEWIRAELDARGMSIRDLAEATGIPENYLSKSLNLNAAKPRRLQVTEVALISKVFEPTEGEQESIRTIPLLGSVPAGKFRPAEELGGRRFPVSDPSTPRNAYALTIQGDSMDLVAPSGTTIVVDPDDKELWPGKRYIIQTEDGESTFKEFQDNPARLVPCSSNPDHREFRLGAEPVLVLGRVYSYTLKDSDLPRRAS